MDQEKGVSVGSAHHQHDAIQDSRIISANETVSEATIAISLDENHESTARSISEENEGIGGKSKGLSLDKALMVKNVEEEEEEERCSSCVIDVKCAGEFGDGDSQRVCRICHLSAWESGKSLVDLIELGCACKGELGFAHSHCAEAWFKLKGNRLCEICGGNAKNITGSVDHRFMEEWNENRSTSGDSSSAERNRGCWHGQPLCNFLMACLVIAFVLPWFFRVDMF